MNCPDEKKINMMLNGMLDAAGAERLRNHIGECERCREYYESVTSAVDRLRTCRPEPRDENYWEELSGKIRGAAAGCAPDFPNGGPRRAAFGTPSMGRLIVDIATVAAAILILILNRGVVVA